MLAEGVRLEDARQAWSLASTAAGYASWSYRRELEARTNDPEAHSLVARGGPQRGGHDDHLQALLLRVPPAVTLFERSGPVERAWWQDTPRSAMSSHCVAGLHHPVARAAWFSSHDERLGAADRIPSPHDGERRPPRGGANQRLAPRCLAARIRRVQDRRMRRRRSAMRFLAPIAALAAILSSCRKSQAPSPSANDGGAPALVLEPLEQPEQEAGPTAPAAEVAAPQRAYADSDDLPPDAGDARCPPADGGKRRFASVHFEIVNGQKPRVTLVIPSIGVRKRVWHTDSPNPQSCVLSQEPEALRVSCSEVMTQTTGKVYARGSDVVLGLVEHGSVESQTRFELPCGTVARFEPVACPAGCWRSQPTSCECVQGVAPPPPASTR